MGANKGDWVQICNIILNVGERAPQVPDDTRNVPLKMWTKGYVTHFAQIGELVEIETVTGRKIKGVLTEINPTFTHSFGKFSPELAKVRDQVKDILFGGDGIE